jgi:cytochrome c oxidase subunit 3
MSLEAIDVPHADHFGSNAAREHAAQLGMWIFLGTEVLLFAALITGYSVYRLSFPEAFALARQHMEVGLGTINTYLLVTASIFVAFATWAVRREKRVIAFALLVGAVALGLGFLGIKAVEYTHHYREGALPGAWYHLETLDRPGANLYFSLYFFLTGLHAIHVMVGLVVLGIMANGVWSGKLNAGYHTPLELGGMYWHLVDVVWLFLWPLLYLV